MKTWGRVLLFAALAAVVGFVGIGAVGYLSVGNQQAAKGTVRCGNNRCIPSLPAQSVVDALRGKGHDCTQDLGAWNCKLKVGETEYTALVHPQGELISELSATVRSPDGRPVTPSKMAFLLWVATLPYGHDSVLTADIEAWITQRVQGGENAAAIIGGYSYQLDAELTRNLSLRVLTEL